jgi:hypothetical protein
MLRCSSVKIIAPPARRYVLTIRATRRWSSDQTSVTNPPPEGVKIGSRCGVKFGSRLTAGCAFFWATSARKKNRERCTPMRAVIGDDPPRPPNERRLSGQRPLQVWRYLRQFPSPCSPSWSLLRQAARSSAHTSRRTGLWQVSRYLRQFPSPCSPNLSLFSQARRNSSH